MQSLNAIRQSTGAILKRARMRLVANREFAGRRAGVGNALVTIGKMRCTRYVRVGESARAIARASVATPCQVVVPADA